MEGVNMDDYVKEQVRSKLIRVKCMNLSAKEKGVVLSRTQKDAVSSAADTFFNALTQEQVSALNVTKDQIEKMFTEFAIADTLSASRPGARNDSSENYIKRLQELEGIAKSIDGVDKTFAVQAGRELRVIVQPEKIDDLGSYKVARDIKNRIEQELQYPGTIKVTVIRETRAIEEAK